MRMMKVTFKQQIRVSVRTNAIDNLPNPTNRQCCNLREAFSIIDDKKISVHQLYKLSIQNIVRPLLICSRTTFYSKYSRYTTTGILPLVEDEWLNVGRTCLIGNNNLSLLNGELSSTVVYAEGIDDLAGKMLFV